MNIKKSDEKECTFNPQINKKSLQMLSSPKSALKKKEEEKERITLNVAKADSRALEQKKKREVHSNHASKQKLNISE